MAGAPRRAVTLLQSAEIRAARPDEAEAVLETLCAAYDLNVDAARPLFYGDPYYALSHKRVLALPEAGIVSCLTVVPVTLRVGGVPVRACGVAGVATRPDHQRQGHAAALLEATVSALWDELGYPLALLHPVSAPFYQRFGWETATSVLPWNAVPSSLPRSEDAAPIRPAVASDWPTIYALHAELTQSQTGACVRDPRRWSVIQMPVPGRETFITEDADGLAGYIVCERREALHIMEMQGRRADARRSLVAFLARQPEPTVEWPTAPTLLQQFDLPCGEASPEPDAMLRIADLPAALSAVHAALYAPVLAASGATLTIHATDAQRLTNTHPLRLTPNGIISDRDHDPCWLRSDIRAFASLYLGCQTPSELAALGLLTCDSAATLALADRLFPAREPYLAPLDQV